jgi:hypothetical protein
MLRDLVLNNHKERRERKEGQAESYPISALFAFLAVK